MGDLIADSGSQPCPTCGGSARPIVYGEVDLETLDGLGDVALGGCVVVIEQSPAWECRRCKARWGIAEAARVRPRRGTSGGA